MNLSEVDRVMLEGMARDQLLQLFTLHIRNIWRVDGLYFIGIEERHGTESATEVDAFCWRVMGKLEARHLRKILDVEKIEPDSLIHILRNTSWALDILEKSYGSSGERSFFKVKRCGTQETRMKKGLGVFPCKKVRYGYLEAFAKELSPEIRVECKFCPPDERPDEAWCEWEFVFQEPR